MANTADLFQPEYPNLTLPATTIVAFLDSTLCEDLVPIEIVRHTWPEFDWAKLAYRPPSEPGTGPLAPEDVEDRFAVGKSIRLCQLYNRAAPDAATADLTVFVGQIEGVDIAMDGDGETIEITARDFSAVLERMTVYGQHVLRNDGSTVLLPGLETVFNPLGRGNAAAQPVTSNGKTRTIFSADTTGARLWDCAEAIHCLLSEYVPCGVLYWPGIEQLLALTQGRLVRDLDVTGLSLLEALQRCCALAGLQFRFVPRLAETGPRQAIVFYRNGYGRAVELNCQPAGETLSLSQTSIATRHSKREFHPITHRYIGQGDFKVYEATFELVKAWDPALEGTSYSQFSASTNPEFYRVKDVYRKWCLNEAGDYTAEPYNRGAPCDLSGVFEHADYVPRRRRFWPALSTDAQSRSLGYLLEVSYDGLNWWPYLHAFNNLLDECGIWLGSDHLDMDTWIAALKGWLRFRLTASVVSDERVTAIIADGPVGSTVPVVDHVLTLPRQFCYRKVSTQSVLAGASGEGFGPPDEADDSAALHKYVRDHAAASPAVMERTDVRTPSLALHFQPGDRVTSAPESRDLLSCRRDSRSTVWIDRVYMDFRNQCTSLHLVRQRMYAS
jgi:hypothetical protein